MRLVGGSVEHVTPSAAGFPRHLAEHDVSLKLAGAGGDGAQTAAMLIAKAAINEGFDATHIPSYGPESRGGTSYADVHVADDEVLSPSSAHPHILVAFNAPSLARFGPLVVPGGTVLYDSSVVAEPPRLGNGVKLVGVPFTEIAVDLGKAVVKNIVALGALQASTGIFPKETFLTAIRQALNDKCALIPLNEEAFAWGVRSVKERPS
jgi:Pyruvate/2-oxoacid:ferredoxin oxidoreductase gamma subunit